MTPTSPNRVLGSLFGLLASVTMAQAANTFTWADYNTPISDVQAGDAFTFNNVAGTSADFTFTFTEVFDSFSNNGIGTDIDQIILNPSNISTNASGNQEFSNGQPIYTGNTNVENLYTHSPLYLSAESLFSGDAMVLTITTSEPVKLSNFVIGDIDRYFPNTRELDSFEDSVQIVAARSGMNVDVTIASTSNTLTIDQTLNKAVSTSGSLLDSLNANSRMIVSTDDYIDSFQIIYRNDEGVSPGSATGRSTPSNSHWITIGDDVQITEFEVENGSPIPEPAPVLLLSLSGLLLLKRYRP